MPWIMPHLELYELHQAAATGSVGPLLRQNLLLHLGGGCKVCLARLKEVGQATPLPPPLGCDDPLIRTLRRLMAAAYGDPFSPESPDLLPSHNHYLQNAGQPLATLRLLIEEIHQMAREGQAEEEFSRMCRAMIDFSLFQTMLEASSLPSSHWPKPLPQTMVELKNLIYKYLGQTYQELGQQEFADALFRESNDPVATVDLVDPSKWLGDKGNLKIN